MNEKRRSGDTRPRRESPATAVFLIEPYQNLLLRIKSTETQKKMLAIFNKPQKGEVKHSFVTILLVLAIVTLLVGAVSVFIIQLSLLTNSPDDYWNRFIREGVSIMIKRSFPLCLRNETAVAIVMLIQDCIGSICEFNSWC